MKATKIEAELARQSRDIGVSIEELRSMCLAAGLKQLRGPGLKVTAKPVSWVEIRMEDLAPDVQEAIQKRATDLGTTPAAIIESTLKDALHKPAIPLPENDRSLGRIARLRSVGTALGLSHEEIKRDIVGPVRRRGSRS